MYAPVPQDPWQCSIHLPPYVILVQVPHRHRMPRDVLQGQDSCLEQPYQPPRLGYKRQLS